jgi:transcription initiation factor TFIIIB Brf1 subunit/transcription initiation factor TFIIB
MVVLDFSSNSQAVRSLGNFTFQAESWGCTATKDPLSGRFCFPLLLTGVKQGSEADQAGLRVGDQFESWSRAMDGPPNFQQVKSSESFTFGARFGHLKRTFVDEDTQKLLEEGGACKMRFRLAPRCSTKRGCGGNIVESRDMCDHCLVCDECGGVQRSSLVSQGAEWRTFSDDDASQTKSRVAVSLASAFTTDSTAVSERQETVLAGVSARTSSLCGARKPGAGSEFAAARREQRKQEEEARARADISRYSDVLGLPAVAKEEALRLFLTVANRSKTVLKSGTCIDAYSSTVLGSIHCASLLTSTPRMINEILAVTDAGAGETAARVSNAVKKIKTANGRSFPAVDPQLLIRYWCSHRLQAPVTLEEHACSWVEHVNRRMAGSAPDTLAAVTLVYAVSVASRVCHEDMCARVSQASGVSAETLRKHVKQLFYY